jgi:hypothetical protein
MKKLFINILIIILPFIITFGFTGYIIRITNEMDSFSSYMKRLGTGQLWGLAYTYYDKQYKFHMANNVVKPDVLALGSSRIMLIKSEEVNDTFSFYNAGAAVQNVFELNEFITQLSYSPKILIVGIDQFWFNSSYTSQKMTFKKGVYDWPEKYTIGSFFNVSGRILYDVLNGKIHVGALANNKNIGLRSRIFNEGFSRDGSYAYNKINSHPATNEDYNFKQSLGQIKNGTDQYAYGNNVNHGNFQTIDTLLSNCERKGITVIAYLPPFAPRIYSAMVNSGKYGYLPKVYDLLVPIFSKHSNCFLFNYTNPKLLKYSDRYYIDCHHPSAVVTLAILKDMIGKVPACQKFFEPLPVLDETEKEWKISCPVYHSIN